MVETGRQHPARYSNESDCGLWSAAAISGSADGPSDNRVAGVDWPSGITRVGVIRGGNWGCHLYFFLKNWRPFLVITVCLSVCLSVSSAVSPQFIFSPKNWRPFFAHHCHFSWFHSGVTPDGCHPTPFLPVRPRTICFYSAQRLDFFAWCVRLSRR